MIGLGLPDLNELGWRWKDALIYLTHGTPNEPTFSVSAIVDRVAPVPLGAIHSTHDEFVPVARGPARAGARKGAEEALDHQGGGSSFQRQPGGVRPVLTRSHHLDYPALGEVRPALSERVRQALPVLAGLVLFVVALEVLRVELRAVSWSELTAAVVGMPRGQLALAIALTVLNYAVLTGYDQLAFAYIGKALPRARIALTSFLAYAIANNVGLGDAVGRFGAVSLLHAMGCHHRGTVTHRLLVLRDVLAWLVRTWRAQSRGDAAARRA